MPHFDAIEFLRAFFPDPIKPGRLWLWTRTHRNGNEHSYWCYGHREAARLIEKFRRTRDLYIGAALQDARLALRIARRRRSRATLGSIRGNAATATAIPALWARIPIGSRGALPGDHQAAYRALEALDLAPSVAVSTPRAAIFFWLLDKLWVIDDEHERARAQHLLYRLQWALDQRGVDLGWRLPPDGDLARLLRLPAGPKENTSLILERFPLGPSDARYRRGDFAHLPEPPPAEAPHSTSPLPDGAPASRQEPLELDPIYDGCSYLRACFDHSGTLDTKAWRAALTLVAPCFGGRERAHDLSSAHPGYDEYATDDEFARALRAPHGPRTCDFFAHRLGGFDEHCSVCPHFGKIHSPADLGRRKGDTP
ncbi:MAG: hypothetical protein GY719_25205 [bacterium]|nr:hypothetical protein [bacterium]